MALLTLDERKAIFKALGLEYNEATIKALQSKYMLRKSDVDGKYGQDTDNMLRTVWNVSQCTKNFKPEEFRCDCGGKFCCGFPSYMKANELRHIQTIRSHYGKPITVTQGLRCTKRNKQLKGSAVNSGHLAGRAIDFYQKGVTDTLTNRKASIKWIKKQANHKYSYGNGINSNGYKVSASYMGNALHTETTGNNMADIPVEKTAEKVVEKVGYSGTFPTLALKKTNAEVIADTIRWAKWIAGDNSFHYGYTNKHGSSDSKKWSPNAHHNGCYFCGTNTTSGGRSKKGITDYQKSYCCNPFVHAAFAHGGCVPSMLEICQKGSSYDYHKGKGYDKSSLFTKLGNIAVANLKAGDVLCRDTHVALYIGGGKIAEASGGDDNKRNSDKWNNSIRIKDVSKSGYSRAYRFKGSVDTSMAIRHGEVSKRVEQLQSYLKWYGISITADGLFGDGTLAAVKKFQTENGLTADGIVGSKTIEKMKAYRK